ncbi:MAG TPA: DUF4157 domain-containing protein [Bradyrhizobium sp.]|nr:DUF4157 domain-containing protein [Bradyrhizobium sp.]
MFSVKLNDPSTKAVVDSTHGPAKTSFEAAPRTSSSSIQQVLRLQRTIGNRATIRLLERNAAVSSSRDSVDDAPTLTRSEPPSSRSPLLPIQAKLRIGDADDPLEREADRVADQVMRMPDRPSVAPRLSLSTSRDHAAQRKCASCEEEEEKLRRKENEHSRNSDHADMRLVEQTISSPGHPLDPLTRVDMEDRFGQDFGAVRIHNDPVAHQSSSAIDAYAYTYGNHIAFGTGQYQPDTEQGRRLLAHELTHVVQQGGAVERKQTTRNESNGAPPSSPGFEYSSAAPAIQRKYFLSFDPRPSGALIHSTVLPLFIKANTDLFIEAPIPGAKKEDVDKGRKGFADLYKATPTGGASRTIGIKFDDDGPAFLTSGGKLDSSVSGYSHNRSSAPQGGKHTPRVRQLRNAPTEIQIGDLKPGFSSESFLGQGQVSDYTSGIRNTASDIRNYLTTNPSEGDANTKWSPNPVSLASLTIPPGLEYPNGTAIKAQPLALYEESFFGAKRIREAYETGLMGRLFVYKDRAPGVWSYEWIPIPIPATTGSGKVNDILDRLNGDVIPAITTVSVDGGVARKPLPAPKTRTLNKVGRRRIQKSEKKFNDAEWKKQHLDPWRASAKAFLGSEKDVGNALVAKTLVDVEERAGHKIGIPAEVRERGKGLDKIKHWNRFGGLYGWLREKFDFVYVKFQKIVQKVKEKVKKLSKSSAAVKFGNWIKATAQVIFKIFKMVGAWAVNQIVDKLLNSLKEGVTNNLKKIVDMFTPEGVKSKIEEFEAVKEKYEKIIAEQEDSLLKTFFGDKLELFEKLEEFEKIADTASTIATLVEWGVRLLACASPPAVGCLWNLAISALQAAFAWLMQTCWFTKKVYAPVISYVEPVKRFPSEVASKIVTEANKYIPIPEGLDPLFAEIRVDTGDFKVDCSEAEDGPGKLTPERKEILDLAEEIGTDKLNAFLELMNKRGAGPWVLLTAERLKAVKGDLKKINVEELRRLAEAKTSPSAGTASLDQLLKEIGKYTKQEEQTEKAFFEQRKREKEQRDAKPGQTKGVGPDSRSGGAKPATQDKAAPLQVLDGKDHVIRGNLAQTKPTDNIYAEVIAPSLAHVKNNPGTISAQIYVDGALRYRVNNIVVRGVFGSEILATPTNIVYVVYYLEYGLQLNIDGQDVLWEQLRWSTSAAR